MATKHLLFLGTALAAIGVDQASKAVVRLWPIGTQANWVPGLFSTVHLENPGGVLGLAASWPLGLKLAVFGVAALGLAIVALSWLARSRADARVAPLGLGLVVGGAVGNSLDRLLQGSVTDFLVLGDVIVRRLLPLVPGVERTPAFNLADAFLGAGITLLGLLVVHALWLARTTEDP